MILSSDKAKERKIARPDPRGIGFGDDEAAQREEEIHCQVAARCEVSPEVDGHVEKEDG